MKAILATLLSILPSSNSLAASGFGKLPPLTYAPNASPEISALLSFLTKHDVAPPSAEIGTKNGLRGVFSTKAIKKGSLAAKIPSNLALALSDPSVGADVVRSGLNFLRYTDDPTWRDYLETLPADPTPTPDFFSEEEIQALEHPSLTKRASERKREIERVAEEAGVEVAKLRFGTWIASSRSFPIPVSEAPSEGVADGVMDVRASKTVRVLVPFLDMINHAAEANCELTLIDPEKDDAWFAIRAKRPIPRGKEITISYGSAICSSADILMDYGFVPEENKIDRVMLKKGGEGVISDLEGWSTTLKEDLQMYEDNRLGENMKRVLEFRIKIKKAYNDK